MLMKGKKIASREPFPIGNQPLGSKCRNSKAQPRRPRRQGRKQTSVGDSAGKSHALQSFAAHPQLLALAPWLVHGLALRTQGRVREKPQSQLRCRALRCELAGTGPQPYNLSRRRKLKNTNSDEGGAIGTGGEETQITSNRRLPVTLNG
jgi:hypothetical protein